MLKSKIDEAEMKVEKVQAQADVIKTGTQFKKIANLDEMNDACSYKLWTKDKLEDELASLHDHLAKLDEVLNQKND